MKKTVVSWKLSQTACQALAKRLKKQKFDSIIAIANGGLVPGKLLSEYLNLPLGIIVAKRYSKKNEPRQKVFLSSKVLWTTKNPKTNKILLVDDIIDQGVTVEKTVLQLHKTLKPKHLEVAVLYYKPDFVQVDLSNVPMHYYKKTKDWIVFPWEQRSV